MRNADNIFVGRSGIINNLTDLITDRRKLLKYNLKMLCVNMCVNMSGFEQDALMEY
jgi:hypothetical protein